MKFSKEEIKEYIDNAIKLCNSGKFGIVNFNGITSEEYEKLLNKIWKNKNGI